MNGSTQGVSICSSSVYIECLQQQGTHSIEVLQTSLTFGVLHDD
jgi:hypothetical protein